MLPLPEGVHHLGAGNMKCALWLRVSHDTGDQTTENQEAPLREWADRLGLEVIKVYSVEGSAWKGAHRKALALAHQDARLGRFKVVLLWSLDRVSREGVLATLEAVNGFERQGCQVWSLQESWTQEARPETRELLLSIYGWIAQSESKRRSERTLAGLGRAKKEGKRLGRHPKDCRCKLHWRQKKRESGNQSTGSVSAAGQG